MIGDTNAQPSVIQTYWRRFTSLLRWLDLLRTLLFSQPKLVFSQVAKYNLKRTHFSLEFQHTISAVWLVILFTSILIFFVTYGRRISKTLNNFSAKLGSDVAKFKKVQTFVRFGDICQVKLDDENLWRRFCVGYGRSDCRNGSKSNWYLYHSSCRKTLRVQVLL